MRLHCPSVPHGGMEGRDVSGEAYSLKLGNYAKCMIRLGHEVITYGSELDPAGRYATEHITLLTSAEQSRYLSEAGGFSWDGKSTLWRRFNQRAGEEINRRKQPGDFLCFINGSTYKPVKDAVPDLMAVEIGVGYFGIFCDYVCYESHTHQAAVLNTIAKDPCVPLFDTVIPAYFDPDDFQTPLARLAVCGDSPYLLFVGRITKNKGIQIAIDTARVSGMKLIIAGAGGKIEGGDFITSDGWASTLDGVDVTYLGKIGRSDRNALMANAHAGIFPSQYLEPLGNVVIEANLLGTPAITTNFGAFTETVQHGVNGFRCQVLRQFADAVEAVKYLDRDRIRKTAIVNYGIEHAGRMYAEFFRMLESVQGGEGWYDLSRPSDIGWLCRA